MLPVIFRLFCGCSIVNGLNEQGRVQSGLAMLALMSDKSRALLGGLKSYPSITIFRHDNSVCVARVRGCQSVDDSKGDVCRAGAK